MARWHGVCSDRPSWHHGMQPNRCLGLGMRWLGTTAPPHRLCGVDGIACTSACPPTCLHARTRLAHHAACAYSPLSAHVCVCAAAAAAVLRAVAPVRRWRHAGAVPARERAAGVAGQQGGAQPLHAPGEAWARPGQAATAAATRQCCCDHALRCAAGRAAMLVCIRARAYLYMCALRAGSRLARRGRGRGAIMQAVEIQHMHACLLAYTHTPPAESCTLPGACHDAHACITSSPV